MKWYKDGKEVNTDRCQVTNKHGVSTLEIYNCRDADGGRYTCNASSKLGSDETSCVVSVQGRSTPGYDRLSNRSFLSRPLNLLGGDTGGLLKAHSAMDLDRSSARGPSTGFRSNLSPLDDTRVPTPSSNTKPAFVGSMPDQVVDVGQPAEFAVRLDGEPAPTVEWLHNGERVSSRAIASFAAGKATLRIPATVPEDAGEYVCRASNIAGSETVKARLTVLLPRPNSPAALTNGVHAPSAEAISGSLPTPTPSTTQGPHPCPTSFILIVSLTCPLSCTRVA